MDHGELLGLWVLYDVEGVRLPCLQVPGGVPEQVRLAWDVLRRLGRRQGVRVFHRLEHRALDPPSGGSWNGVTERGRRPSRGPSGSSWFYSWTHSGLPALHQVRGRGTGSAVSGESPGVPFPLSPTLRCVLSPNPEIREGTTKYRHIGTKGVRYLNPQVGEVTLLPRHIVWLRGSRVCRGRTGENGRGLGGGWNVVTW